MLKSTLPRLGQSPSAGAAYSKVWSTTIKIPGLAQTTVPPTVPHIHDDLEEASSLVHDMLTRHKGRTVIMTGAGKCLYPSMYCIVVVNEVSRRIHGLWYP